MSYLAVVEEADFLFLLDQTGLTRGNMSSHIAKLEKAGYLEVGQDVRRTETAHYLPSHSGRAHGVR